MKKLKNKSKIAIIILSIILAISVALNIWLFLSKKWVMVSQYTDGIKTGAVQGFEVGLNTGRKCGQECSGNIRLRFNKDLQLWTEE